MVVALLAGGTGSAKLAAGLRDILLDPRFASGPGGELNVIANTGDDIEIYDAHVSPDPDLITFRLAGVIDERGFGVKGETHDEMDRRRAHGEDIWFELGDDDLAVCRARSDALAGGATLTAAHEQATAAYDTRGARVLPMSNDPVRTVVRTPAGPRGLQQFLIQDRSEPAIEEVLFGGAATAAPTNEVLDAIARADLVVIGPSNPVISIGPILAMPRLRDALAAAAAPVLAVSPFVGGEVLKGPTAKFLSASGVTADSSGVAAHLRARYGEIVDAMIADDPVAGLPHHLAGVRMADDDEQRAVASEVLRYGSSLSR